MAGDWIQVFFPRACIKCTGDAARKLADIPKKRITQEKEKEKEEEETGFHALLPPAAKEPDDSLRRIHENRSRREALVELLLLPGGDAILPPRDVPKAFGGDAMKPPALADDIKAKLLCGGEAESLRSLGEAPRKPPLLGGDAEWPLYEDGT